MIIHTIYRVGPKTVRGRLHTPIFCCSWRWVSQIAIKVYWLLYRQPCYLMDDLGDWPINEEWVDDHTEYPGD